MHNLYDYFTVKHDSIVGANGSEFIFKALEFFYFETDAGFLCNIYIYVQ